jgi:hypothetical protein
MVQERARHTGRQANKQTGVNMSARSDPMGLVERQTDTIQSPQHPLEGIPEGFHFHSVITADERGNAIVPGTESESLDCQFQS